MMQLELMMMMELDSFLSLSLCVWSCERVRSRSRAAQVLMVAKAAFQWEASPDRPASILSSGSHGHGSTDRGPLLFGIATLSVSVAVIHHLHTKTKKTTGSEAEAFLSTTALHRTTPRTAGVVSPQLSCVCTLTNLSLAST